MITASAPGKLMLFGEHSVVYGHPCIVTAVDARIYVSVARISELILEIEAPELQKEKYTVTIENLAKDTSSPVMFIEAAYYIFLQEYPHSGGIQVSTKSDFSKNYGFGSSAASTVAFVTALSLLCNVELTKKELFDICYKAVIMVQGAGSGFDIAAAIWGGTIYYVSPAKVVEPLVHDTLPLHIIYSGVKASSVKMMKQVALLDKTLTQKIFKNITKITEQAKQALIRKDWPLLYSCMNNNQKLLEQLGVSTPLLTSCMNIAKSNGSIAGKLSGAGGGDCILVSPTNNYQKLLQEIHTVGAKIIDADFAAKGVRIEKGAKVR